jgi:serine/threonine-protein kinase
MVKRTTFYRFIGNPLGEGGFAKVWKARNKETGEDVALKEPFADKLAKDRLRREIDVQSRLVHPHIMPILQADPDFGWFTMPLAIGNLRQLRDSLDEEDLAELLHDIADALEVAHAAECIHRDVTPNNILAIPDQDSPIGRRWVIADWGLVRQPDSEVSRRLTKSNQLLGTLGFMAPETYVDGHQATPASDVYSVGRVAAWFICREEPNTFYELNPEGDSQHWRNFVRSCTNLQPSRRPNDMVQLKALLDQVFLRPSLPPANVARKLVDELIIDGGTDLGDIIALATENSNDGAVYIDHVARLPRARLFEWARGAPETASRIALRMLSHLGTIEWGDRGEEYASTPLSFSHTILQALVESGELGLAEDVAKEFFEQEVKWSNARQKNRTETWLSTIGEPAGTAIARALLASNAVAYHRQVGTWRAQSPAIHATLAVESLR